MAFLTWHARYSVGHAQIDAQHRQLFELVNDIDDLVKLGMTPELVGILEILILCTVDHFTFEEEEMRVIGFPQSMKHQQMHQELTDQVQATLARMKAGGTVSLRSMVVFLADWLTNHILREDMEYKPYLK